VLTVGGRRIDDGHEASLLRRPSFQAGIAASVDPLHRATYTPSNDGAEETILRAALVEALLHLTRRQREAIVLIHLLGYSATDAARAMSVSTSSVRQHASRGLGHLRTRLSDDDHMILLPKEAT
jgi:RNA polymerase sigma factor (sigma-70 family)